jgi:hypothetical protein
MYKPLASPAEADHRADFYVKDPFRELEISILIVELEYSILRCDT